VQDFACISESQPPIYGQISSEMSCKTMAQKFCFVEKKNIFPGTAMFGQQK
jgi:hypothetical protein